MSLGRKDTVAARISQYLEVAPPSDAAQAADVIVGKQFITTGYAFQTGTMPDNGDLGTITPTTTDQPIPVGHTLGGTVLGDADLLPANIIDGVSIFGVVGTGGVPTGTAQPSEVLVGETFMNAGGPQTGTMPNNGSLGTITPTTTNQSIPAGFTTGGTVAGSPNLLAGNIRISTDIFGVIGTLDPGTQTGGDAVSANVLTGKTFTNDSGQQIGTMANRAGDTAALSSTVAGTTLKLLPSDGYRDGVDDYVTITDADFAASNIKKDVNVLGILGTYQDATVVVGQTEETYDFTETISINDPVFMSFASGAKLANPASLPANTGQSVAFSPDGVYMAVGVQTTSPFLAIYKRAGDVFTKLSDPATLPTGNGFGVTFSPDGVYLVVAHATSPFITIYKRAGDVFTKLADPTTLPTGAGRSVSFSSDMTYMAVAHDITPFITIYKLASDVFTKLANPATLPTGAGYGASFSSDMVYLAIAHDISPFATIYKRSGDTFTKLTNPATLPTGSGRGVSFSTDITYLAVAHSTSPYLTIYKRAGDVFTKLAGVTGGTLNNNATSVSFSPDGDLLAVGYVISSPFVSMYKRLGDTFTGLASPGTSPASVVNGLAFSPDSSNLACAHITTPFITIYKMPRNCSKSDNLRNWVNADRLGYAKEAGLTGERKRVIVTHR